MANLSNSQAGLTAVAIDRDKNSQYALRWAVNNLNVKDGIILLHVRTQQQLQPQDIVPKGGREPTQSELQQLFLSYRGYCARKGVEAKEVVLHDLDVACALVEFINNNFITSIVLGGSSRNVISRAFKTPDVPTSLAKSAPDFCRVYAITKDKVQSVKSSTRPPTPSGISPRLPSPAGSLPETPHSHDHNIEGSWRGVRPEGSSFDGGNQRVSIERGSEFRVFPHWERATSKNVSPQQSVTSSKNSSPQHSMTSGNDSMQTTPRNRQFTANNRNNEFKLLPYWESTGSKNVSPQHSATNSLNSSPLQSMIGGSEFMQMTPRNRNFGSNNNSPVHPSYNTLNERIRQSGSHNRSPTSISGNDFMQITTHNRTGSNIPSPLHSPYNANNQFRFNFKGSPLNSTAGSSNHSATPSFQSSDWSFEQLEPSGLSDVSRNSSNSQATGEVEEELRKLRLELKQTMEMFNSACKETMEANNKVREIDQWKSEEAQKLEEFKQAQEAALAAAHFERQRCKAAIEAAQMAQQLADLEMQKRKYAEMRLQREAAGKKKAVEATGQNIVHYRGYSIEELETATGNFSSSEKIGEGGYGPVYKGYLDHTNVAIKVLRPDMSQGKKQFNQEVEVLSRMRHPNLVLLLGACPEYGCLVYEYLANGSLEDRLFCKNNTPSIPWSIRFKIASEIATALLFLHQAKPEPVVHRDLKPANILLDRNYVSKISDVGLARLVPASAADNITQCCITAAAGTFCYIDPEYQQTGMLGTKSDLYSLGVILLQIVTAKPPMGLSHQVENAIESGKFAEILDPTVKDWPVEEALSFTKLALSCCELRRRDRPDLGSVILPELRRLSNLDSANADGVDFISPSSSHYQSFADSLDSSQVSQNAFLPYDNMTE